MCDAVANQGLPYSLSLADAAGDGSGAIGILGGGCTQDYITIEGGSEVCGSPIFYSKFCGDVLSTYTGGAAPVPNNPICGKFKIKEKKISCLVQFLFKCDRLASHF